MMLSIWKCSIYLWAGENGCGLSQRLDSSNPWLHNQIGHYFHDSTRCILFKPSYPAFYYAFCYLFDLILLQNRPFEFYLLEEPKLNLASSYSRNATAQSIGMVWPAYTRAVQFISKEFDIFTCTTTPTVTKPNLIRRLIKLIRFEIYNF